MKRRTFLQRATAASALCASLEVLAKARSLDLSQLTSSTASLSGMSFEKALLTIHDLGFGGVEILTFTGATHSVGPIPGAVVADLTSTEKHRFRALVGKFKHVTTHLPFHDMRPVAADLTVRKATLDRLHQAIDDSAFWGASLAVLHVRPEPGESYEQMWPELLKVYRELGDHAARYNLRLGIETGAPNTVRQYLALIHELRHDFVGGTIDTGHTRAYLADIRIESRDRATSLGAKRYNDVLMEKVEGLGPKLFHFHVDDVRPADWREHRALGTGLVDWKRLLTYLTRIGYRGTFAVELEEQNPVAQLRAARQFFATCLKDAAEGTNGT